MLDRLNKCKIKRLSDKYTPHETGMDEKLQQVFQLSLNPFQCFHLNGKEVRAKAANKYAGNGRKLGERISKDE